MPDDIPRHFTTFIKIMGLTAKQQKAVMMALAGDSWKTIAENLNVNRATLWDWRQKPEWQQEFDRCYKIMEDEMLIFGAEKLQEAYHELFNLGVNKRVPPKDRVTALTNYIDRVKRTKTEKEMSNLKNIITPIIEDWNEEVSQ